MLLKSSLRATVHSLLTTELKKNIHPIKAVGCNTFQPVAFSWPLMAALHLTTNSQKAKFQFAMFT